MWSLASRWNFFLHWQKKKIQLTRKERCVRALPCWQAFEPIALIVFHKCAGLSGGWEWGQRVWQIPCEVWIMPILDPSVHSPCTPCWMPGDIPGPGACCEGPGWAGRRCRWWPSFPSAWPPTSLPPCPDTCPGSGPSRFCSGASPRRQRPGAEGAERCPSTSAHMNASSFKGAQDWGTGRCPANATRTWKTNKRNWSSASDLLKNFYQD